MRVLAVTPYYPPSSRVGAWLATHGHLRRLVARGHDVQAFSARGYGRPYTHDGVRVTTGQRGASWPARHADRPDVVVGHTQDGGVAGRVAAAWDVPLVRMAHGHGPDVAGGQLVVWNSHSLRDVSPDPGCPSVVAAPPLDLAVWQPADVPGRQAVGLVNLSRDKGVDTVWQVAEQLDDRPWLGCRGGYGEQRLPRLPHFEVVGPTQDMTRDVYSRLRLLLMPSRVETWGMVALEAAAAGVPTIAHPTPGLVEALGGAAAGWVDRDDIGGWVDAVRRLDDPDVYAQAQQAARRRAGQVAGWDTPQTVARAVEQTVTGGVVCAS